MGNWVLFELGNSRFAVRADEVLEMVILDHATKAPGSPPDVRGLLNLRGKIIPLLDLRMHLGMTCATQEVEDLCSMLDAREQDHVRWLNELEACVRESREFKLALDPTKCAFGKWYYSYHADNAVLRMQLLKLAEPHRRIHETGVHVLEALGGGDAERAHELMAAAKTGTLATLRQLLADTRRVVREAHREIAVVVETGNDRWGLVVDAVIGVRAIEDAQIERAQPGSLGVGEDHLVGFCSDSAGMILLLDLRTLALRS